MFKIALRGIDYFAGHRNAILILIMVSFLRYLYLKDITYLITAALDRKNCKLKAVNLNSFDEKEMLLGA